MSTRFARWFWVLVLVTGCLPLAGCAERKPASSGPAESKHALAKSEVPPAMAELLAQSRQELAKRCENLVNEIRSREEAKRKGDLKYKLLPRVSLPLVLAPFQDMQYVAAEGISLPAYAVDEKDPGVRRALALVYARFGDHEAAAQLAGQDPELDKYRTERNYPAEWTRYVALRTHVLQQLIALGETDEINRLLEWHKQIEQTLDAKAKQGALGHALLPRGRRVLQLVAALQDKNQQAAADKARQALQEWPAPTELPSPSAFPAKRTDWAQFVKGPAEGRVVVAQPPGRALDLLQLPFPGGLAFAVALDFDSQDRLHDILVTYAPRIREESSFAATELASVLGEWVAPNQDSNANLCTQRWGEWTCQTTLSPTNPILGGWVRLTRDAGKNAATLPRDWGSIHFNRSFDRNRLLLDKSAKPAASVVIRPDAKAAHPLPKYTLQDITLTRLGEYDLLAGALFRYRPEATTNVGLHQLALPLFARLGLGQMAEVAATKERGTHLQVAWEDAVAKVVLRVPHDSSRPVEVEITDRRDASRAAERDKEVLALEDIERAQRLKENKPLQTLPRTMAPFEFSLGWNRDRVIGYLKQFSFKTKEFADGVLFIAPGGAPKDKPSMIREIMVRFNKDNRLAWARLRYEQGTPKTPQDRNWPNQVLGTWQASGGVVGPTSSPLLPRTADLSKKPATGVFYRWRDDTTEATYYFDPRLVFVELTLGDRPVDADKAPLPPLSFLPRGPAGIGITVDMTPAEIEAKLGSKPEKSADGASVVRPTSGTYDEIRLWIEGDKVRRIAVRYRLDPKEKPKLAGSEMQRALIEMTSRWSEILGAPDRADDTDQELLQSLSWFDDVTRFRLYWLESDDGPPRIWSEWRDDKTK